MPTFTNHSDTPELDRILAEAVREELRGRGHFTIVQEAGRRRCAAHGDGQPGDASVAALNENRQAQRYLITVNATVEFKDVKDNKVLWSNPSLRAATSMTRPPA